MSIHSTIEHFRKRRSGHKTRLNELVCSTSGVDVVNVGVRVYEQMAEARWQIDALDYVLSGVEDKSVDLFVSTLESIQRDLIYAGSDPYVMHKSYAPAYWKELGMIERIMRMALPKIKKAQEDSMCWRSQGSYV